MIMLARLCIVVGAWVALTGCPDRPAVLTDASVETRRDRGQPEAAPRDLHTDAPSCVNTDKAKHHWAAAATSPGGLGYIKPSGLALGASGQLHVAGEFIGDATFGSTTFKVASPTQRNYFFAKLSASGSYLWARSIPLGGKYTSPIHLAVNKAGEIWAAGTYQGSISFGSTTLTATGNSDVFLVKLSPGGSYLQALSTSGSGEEAAGDLVIDVGGDLHLAGTYRSGDARLGAATLPTATKGNLFLARLKPDGSNSWVVAAGGPGGRFLGNDLVVAAGGALLAGRFAGTVQLGTTTLTDKGSCGVFLNDDLFVARISMGGKIDWAVQIRNEDTCGEFLGGVFAHGVGGALVTGSMTGTGVFGSRVVPGKSTHNLFVAEISGTGKVDRADFIKRSSAIGAGGTAAVAGSTLLLAGSFEKGVTFGGTTLCNRGDRDIYVARYDLITRAFTWAYSAGGPQMDDAELLAADSAGKLHLSGSAGSGAILGDSKLEGIAPVYFWSLQPL